MVCECEMNGRWENIKQNISGYEYGWIKSSYLQRNFENKSHYKGWSSNTCLTFQFESVENYWVLTVTVIAIIAKANNTVALKKLKIRLK